MSAATTSRGGRALLGLLLCIAAPFAWAFTMDHPWLRLTGAAMWVLLVSGLLVGIGAARADRRKWVVALAIVDGLLTAYLVYGCFFLTRLPETPGADALERAPDFTLPSHAGQPVSLSAELARGPVLLVFYRGFW